MKNLNNHLSEKLTLVDKAYLMLAEQIVSLRLQPGQLLVEKDLVGLTGIGRTPVREAIQRLAAAGLLQVLPRKGLMVTMLSRSELAMMLEARKVLERLLVVKAAERATADQRQGLQSLAVHIEALDDDLAGFLEIDVRLEDLLGSAGHNPYLVAALAPMHTQCRRLWYLHHSGLDHFRVTYLHGALAKMVSEGNAAGAIRALDEIIATLEDLVNTVDVLS